MAGPGTPYYNPSPAIASGFIADPRTGKSGLTNPGAAASSWKTWEDVIRNDPNLKGRSPDEVTNYLRATYGLPNTYRVNEYGKVVDAHNWFARNLWWAGPAIIVGGAAVGALAGGGGGGAAGAASGSGLGSASPATAAGLNAAAGGAAGGIPAGVGPYLFGGGGVSGLTGPLLAENAMLAKGGLPSSILDYLKGLGGDAAKNALGNTGSSLGKSILDKLLNPQTAFSLASLIPLLTGKGGPGGNAQLPTQKPAMDNPDVQAMLSLAKTQAQRADPLHQGAVNTAFARLPIYARQGITKP